MYYEEDLEEELIQEISDDDIIWEEELIDVYIENGEEFALDDLINDFYIFCCYMFYRAGFAKPTKIQKMIIDFIAKPSKRDKLIQAPRGAGKSYISQLKVLWDMLRDNDEHILVRSASSKRSRNYTTFLLNLIKTTPLLQHLSPRNNQRKSTELFDVNGAKPSDSPSVLSAGISGTVTGLRASRCILDDVEVVKNSTTPETRETLNNQINENFNLLTESNGVSGEVLVLGTFQTSDSVYVPMVRSGAYDCLIIPAEYPPLDAWYLEMVSEDIMEVSKNNPEMIGRAIDERLDDDFLSKRKLRAGRSNYELHYMLNPNLQDELKYPLKLRDLIVMDIDPIDNPIRIIYSSEEKVRDLKHKGFNSDYFVKPAWTSPERVGFDFTILAIDPSGRGTDETGYVVMSLMGGKIFVRDFGGLQGGYEDSTFDTLIAIAKKYTVNAVIVESNFGDGAYAKMMGNKLIDNHNCVLEEVRASGQKEARIIDALEPLMNQHRIIVDRQALEKDNDAKAVYSLTYQMTHLTKLRNCLQHDDRIDVWELGATYLIEYLNGEHKAFDRHNEDQQKKIDALFEDGLFPHLQQRRISNSWNNNKW